jgi:hypothetical protein
MKRFFRIAAVCSIAAAVAASAGPGFAAQKQKTAAPAESSALSGKVVETMNSGGYTYVCLEKKGKKTWVAVPEMKVAVGSEMAFQPGGEMLNFNSKSLKKTFASIIFSAGPVTPGSPSVKPAGTVAAGSATGGAKAAAAPANKNVKVEKAKGANAYTVSEVFEKRAKLDKKAAVVRGKVVKVSRAIMGSNWVHLQDGTGDPKTGTHDLVVTTPDLPKVGDVVTAKGTVAKDKDFGSGYKYTVIMEKGKIQP